METEVIEQGGPTFQKTFNEDGSRTVIEPTVVQAAPIEQPITDKPGDVVAAPAPTDPTAAELKAQLKEWQDKAAEHENRYKALEPEITGYKTKIEELSKPTNPFEGDEDGALFYKLQQIKKKNPELYPILKESALGNPDNAKLWKLNFLKDNPEFKDQPAVVQRKLERAYPALFGDGSMLSEPDKEADPTAYQEYQDQMLDLQLDGKKIKKEFLSALDGIELPKVEDKTAAQAQAQAAEAKLIGDWKPTFDTLDKELSAKQKIEIKFDKDTMPLEMEISPAQKNKMLQGAAFLVLSQKLPNNAETMGKVKAYLKQETDAFVVEAQKLVIAAVTTRDEQWKKITGGKLPIRSTDVETAGSFSGMNDLMEKGKKIKNRT